MLKYEININNVFSDNLRINYSHYDVEDIDFIDDERTLVTCYYYNDIDIKEGDFIIAVLNDSTLNDNNFVTTASKIKEIEVTGVDTDERFFTVVSDKYCELKGSYMSRERIVEYEDDIIYPESYEAKTEEEKSYYDVLEYVWKPDGISDDNIIITESAWNSLENDYAKDSYTHCYKNNTDSEDIITVWAYESLDSEEQSDYTYYANHMMLSPYVYTTIDSGEYERLLPYEKENYKPKNYIYPNGKEVVVDYLYVWFKEKHFFKKDTATKPIIFFDCLDEDGNEYRLRLDEGDIINDYGLRFLRSDETDRLYEFISADQKFRYSGPYGEEEVPEPPVPFVDNGYFIARLDDIKVLRYDIIFPPISDSAEVDVSLFLKKHMTSINIPIQQVFSTDMYKDEIIKEKFIDVETKKAINEYVEMEKDVYHPVVLNNGEFVNVKEIRFNLHFREHRNDEWIADPDSFWNGTYINNGEITLMNDANAEQYGYYSYSQKDKQSDLLSYLNFSNNDVRFQKNVIKKSFLRLSFYDSPRQTDQQLLQFSTIFMDCGKLFGKYGRNFLRPSSYSHLSLTSDEGETKSGLDGIRVDREPYNIRKTDDENIEDYRLSSQFSVKDRYSSLSSSDGFYLYLWKDNDLGFTPSDIYLKVEFNHAGYGRTIPFMMPFKKSGGIKSFQEILNDWNEKENSDGKYGIRQYLRYSYIHFKYKYDKDTQRHIYYLDNDQYGNISLDNGNVLNINLWEAKVL